MKIAIIGYGRMGKEVEGIALERGHSIVLKIDKDNMSDLTAEKLSTADVAIEFTIPDSAEENVIKCFEADLPVVCGTTGWNEKMNEAIDYCQTQNKTFFHASNFSLGVNLFFKINDVLSSMMNNYPDYDVSMEETHHIHKKDAPSGTAISLAEILLKNLERKSEWKLAEKPEAPSVISIEAKREDMVPGIHKITYESEFDTIKLEHSAKNRKGFALGAVLAAEFIKDKKGCYTMDDLLKL